MVQLIQYFGATKFQKKEYITLTQRQNVFMKMNENNYPQVYLEECRYKTKKKKMVKFIDVELGLNVSLDSNDSNSE